MNEVFGRKRAKNKARRLVKNPSIVAVRFIGLFNRASFINETSTKNHFFTTLLEIAMRLLGEGKIA